MQADKISISYPWNNSTYGTIAALCVRIALTAVIIAYMSLSAAWIILFVVLCIAVLITASDLFMMATKAPVVIDMLRDSLCLHFAFGRRITLSYEQVRSLVYDATKKRTFGWTAKLDTSTGSEFVIAHVSMPGFGILAKTLVERNPECVVDSQFLQLETGQR